LTSLFNVIDCKRLVGELFILTSRPFNVLGTRTRPTINKLIKWIHISLVGESVEHICIKSNLILSFMCILAWVISKACSMALWCEHSSPDDKVVSEYCLVQVRYN